MCGRASRSSSRSPGSRVACSDSSAKTDAAATTSTTQPRAGTATIVAFTVPESVPCGGKTSVTTTVTFQTTGAKTNEVYVDGAPVADVAADHADIEVHCDPLPHTVVLTAVDGDGGRTTDKKLLTTDTNS